MGEETFLNASSSARKRTRQVADQVLAVGLGIHLVPKRTGLLVRGVWVPVLVAAGLALQIFLCPSESGVLAGAAK